MMLSDRSAHNACYARLDFRRLPGPVFDPPRKELFRGMSAGSFSRTAAGNRAYCYARIEITGIRGFPLRDAKTAAPLVSLKIFQNMSPKLLDLK